MTKLVAGCYSPTDSPDLNVTGQGIQLLRHISVHNVGSSFDILGSDGHFVVGVGRETGDGVFENSLLHCSYLHIVQTQSMEEIGA